METSSSGFRCALTSSMLFGQLAEALQRVVLALDRDQHLLAGHQRVDREQAERRRAVDEDVVERRSSCALRCARCSRDSRATSETSSISAPARSMVAGTHHRFGMPVDRLDHLGQRRAVDQQS